MKNKIVDIAQFREAALAKKRGTMKIDSTILSSLGIQKFKKERVLESANIKTQRGDQVEVKTSQSLDKVLSAMINDPQKSSRLFKDLDANRVDFLVSGESVSKKNELPLEAANLLTDHVIQAMFADPAFAHEVHNDLDPERVEALLKNDS